MNLRLEVTEFRDEAHWRWRLTDGRGSFIADHSVALDREAVEYQGFVDSYRFLLWHADPARGIEEERALVGRLGRWIGRLVWGAVGEAIAERASQAPVVVVVSLPAEAEVLLFRPLELGFVGKQPLASQDVSLVFELAGAHRGEKAPIGDRLRMLALFSVPTDQAALNARYEQYELRQLVKRIARTGKRAIELRVLQYGVTREALSEVLHEHGGWDLIHFSGHGLPAGLVLELLDGTADLVSSEELGDLLWPVRDQLKLVTLSSCESAAATAAQTMRLLGLPAHTGEEIQRDGEQMLPAVAHGLAGKLGCAALAMRYPVGDEFAIELARNLYQGLFKDGQPLARALQVAISRTTAPGVGDAMPPLSVATPALFGAAAVELSLEPPLLAPEQPPIFDLSTAGLAHFPPEPRLFVGRVGSLARASSALAPTGPHHAVLFHGMAGAGKTACALELAYRHQEGRFEAMAWHSAPREGQDIGGALAGFAIALDTQLSGLELASAVDDREPLERMLPRLTRALSDRAALIVLDNIESLLSPDGTWRDERWELLIEALIAHDGLSRLVLTSRHVPARLAGDERVSIERVDSLSASESILLARRLPNLGALIQTGGEEGQDAGRQLARRVLETVQGNPKLIELADRQASDPDVLRERLDDAAAAWGDSADRLAAFFAGDQPSYDHAAEDFLRVLEAWTSGAVQRLPEEACTAFQLICALEGSDRIGVIVESNWKELWERIEGPGEAPDPYAALEIVASHGLIDIQPGDKRLGDRYHVHPAVEHAGRQAAAAGFQALVDAEFAGFWERGFGHGLITEAHGQAGGLVIRAGLAAAPYLLRLERPNDARAVLERVIARDNSTRTLAVVLPLLERVAEQCAGTPTELGSVLALLSARAIHQPAEALAPMRELLDRAVREEDFELANSVASDLINLLFRAQRLEEALALTETKVEYARIAGQGPWTQLADEGTRLLILQAQGHNDLVLKEIDSLRERMDLLDQDHNQGEFVEPWNVRETTLDIAHSAALELHRFNVALELNKEIMKSARERGASRYQLARTAVNDYGPLLNMGRFDDAENLLRECRAVFEQEQSREGLALVYGAWSDLEDDRGHYDQAIVFGRRSLRLDYALGNPNHIASDHHNLANYLENANDSTEHASHSPALILAHQIASAMIAYQAASGELAIYLDALQRHAQAVGEEALPSSFAELCKRLQDEEEVDFEQVFAALPPTAPTGEDALREVIAQSKNRSSAHSPDTNRLLDLWKRAIAVTVAAAHGDPDAKSALEPFLAELAKHAEGAALSGILSRIVAGERNRQALLAGLDATGTTIASALLDQLQEPASK